MLNLLVRTPPQTGPTTAITRMAMGINRATLCWCSVERESRAPGKWNTREDTTAHRNTPYHISGTHKQRRWNTDCVQFTHAVQFNELGYSWNGNCVSLRLAVSPFYRPIFIVRNCKSVTESKQIRINFDFKKRCMPYFIWRCAAHMTYI